MKISEIRKMTSEELNKKVTESKKELFNSKLKQSTGSLEKPHKMRELRKDVAKMKTVLKEMEMEASK